MNGMTWALRTLLPLLAAAASNAQPASPSTAVQAAAGGPSGVLAVRGVQGTSGAPGVGLADVDIDFLVGDRSVRHISTKFDDSGIVVITDAPLGPGIRPAVRIKHSGVTYQEIGPVLDVANPHASMDVTVYETTDSAPDWVIPMRHIMAAATPGGHQVTETVVVENPSDRTWLGGPADPQGRRAVVQLGIPAGASNVQLVSGFHGWCCTAVNGSTLTIQMPLMPGRSSFQFSYRVAAQGGRTDLRIGAAATIQNAMFFVPDDSSKVEAQGVAAMGSQAVGGSPMRTYQAQGLSPGMLAGVIVEASTAAGRGMAPPSGSGTGLEIGIGAAIVAVGLAAFGYVRSVRRAAAAVHIRHGEPRP